MRLSLTQPPFDPIAFCIFPFSLPLWDPATSARLSLSAHCPPSPQVSLQLNQSFVATTASPREQKSAVSCAKEKKRVRGEGATATSAAKVAWVAVTVLNSVSVELAVCYCNVSCSLEYLCVCFTVINKTQFSVQAIYTSVIGSSAQIYVGHVTVFRTSLPNTLRLGCVWVMPILALPNVGMSWLANFFGQGIHHPHLANYLAKICEMKGCTHWQPKFNR